jgi:hypothetical protein
MKIYIKVAVAFFILFFGVVALMEFNSKRKKQGAFLLINQVEESDLAFHADIKKLFHEIDKYGKKKEVTLTSRLLTSQVKQQLLKSGLKLEETYVTYSMYGNQTSSFYAEILDTAIFSAAFKRFTQYFDLEPTEENSFFYQSSTVDLSLEKHPKYVKINWGKHAAQEKPNKHKKSNPLFKHLLNSASHGVINTLGTPSIDSNEYATFTYEYGQDFIFTLNWKVAGNHPIQMKNKAIPIYPSQKNKVHTYVNIEIEQLKLNTNSFLKQKGTAYFKKLPPAVKEMLQLWNGEASLQMGGKITTETVQFVTEFDDDFNQVERKVIKTDSIPDLGIYWGTSDPKAAYNLLKGLPNVKTQNNQLQLALFPPLVVKAEKESLKATPTDVSFKKEETKYILLINSDNAFLKGRFTIEKTNKDNVRLQLILKDPSVPEKLNISSFW